MKSGDKQELLFDLPELPSLPSPPKVGVTAAVWTENKAKLIERYLYYFVLITKHGNYIDGFAGPQRPELASAWSAKLVLESQPYWLKRFFLYDSAPAQAERLDALRQSALAACSSRVVQTRCGDFNAEVDALLASQQLPIKEATFCLLDQRTFECHWATLVKLAGYKAREKYKMELFYFLPQGWIDRALSAQKDVSVLERWWGRPDWESLRSMRAYDRRETFLRRFQEELGYLYVYPWPIYDKPANGRRVMYYMIHATDHKSAPVLMERAYANAVKPKEPQAELFRDLQI